MPTPACPLRDCPVCAEVATNLCVAPTNHPRPQDVRIVLISECAPPNPSDWYHAEGDPLFAQTTVQAFRDAGAEVSSISEIVGLGVYLTCAVKCAKTAAGIATGTVDQCAHVLEQELAPFTSVAAWLLMGDVAIRAVNTISKRTGEGRVIPAGSTYRIRSGEYHFRGGRAFPSYLQAGPSFFIEKSKREMIAQDIRAALGVVGG